MIEGSNSEYFERYVSASALLKATGDGYGKVRAVELVLPSKSIDFSSGEMNKP